MNSGLSIPSELAAVFAEKAKLTARGLALVLRNDDSRDTSPGAEAGSFRIEIIQHCVAWVNGIETTEQPASLVMQKLRQTEEDLRRILTAIPKEDLWRTLEDMAKSGACSDDQQALSKLCQNNLPELCAGLLNIFGKDSDSNFAALALTLTALKSYRAYLVKRPSTTDAAGSATAATTLDQLRLPQN